MSERIQQKKQEIHKYIQRATDSLNKLRELADNYPGGPPALKTEVECRYQAWQVSEHAKYARQEFGKLFRSEKRRHDFLTKGKEIRIYSMLCPSCSGRSLQIRGTREDGSHFTIWSIREKDDLAQYRNCKVRCGYCQESFGPIVGKLLKSKDRRKIMKNAKRAELERTRARAAVQAI